MTTKTTFKQYLKNHPFGTYELYTETLRKLLTIERMNNSTPTKPALKPFTIWMERKKPTNKNSVFRIAGRMGISADRLIERLEKEANTFASEGSLIGAEKLSKLN